FAQAIEFGEGRVGELFGGTGVLRHGAGDVDQVGAVVAVEVRPRRLVTFGAGDGQTEVVAVERGEVIGDGLARGGGRAGVAGRLFDLCAEILFRRGVQRRGQLCLADAVRLADARRDFTDLFFERLLKVFNRHGSSGRSSGLARWLNGQFEARLC